MLPHYSEFSYGFALTNEIVGLITLNAAPIFPSLIEEGKTGGGYDVKLDIPGLPLFLQFKRSEKMMMKSAREYKLIQNLVGFSSHAGLDTPFFRFPITDSNKSQQHKMLCDLDNGSNLVFYAAPSFYEISELNEAWANKSLIRRSIFVKPIDIGDLTPGGHTVSWDSLDNAWLCSEPKKINSTSSSTLVEEIREKLSKRDNLRSELKTLSEKLIVIEERLLRGDYLDASDEKTYGGYYDRILSASRPKTLLGSPLLLKGPKELDEEGQLLRDIADRSAQLFGAQLIIIQPHD